MNALAALSDTGNERIAMGGNMPPAIEAHRASIEDLRSEAEVWLDGAKVTTAEEAEGIDTLIKLARAARDEADKARAAEKKPHDDAAKAVQAKWKPLVDTAQRVLDVCLEKVGAWRTAEADRKQAEADKARAEFEEQQRIAREALQASSGNLAAREQAEQQETAAKAAAKIMKRAKKAATTGTGLRTVWDVQVTDARALAGHYWKTRSAEVDAFFLGLARSDVHGGARSIPGCTITPQKKAI